MNITVKKLSKEYLNSVAELHKVTYEQDHFTSKFSVRMLEKYYEEIIADNSYTFVAIDETNEVVGVALAGEKTKISIKRFIRKYWADLLFVLLQNPSFVVNKVKDFFIIFSKRGQAKNTSIAPVRYLNLVVSKKLQKRGIGQMLQNEFESALKRDGITMFGSSVKKSNQKSINLQLKNGCEIEYETDTMVYFIKRLS